MSSKAKATTKSNGGTKVSFSSARGKSSQGKNSTAIKFSTMNKRKRASYKAYRGQGSAR